jgi:tetratricopeptide (TPR) repeat protein
MNLRLGRLKSLALAGFFLGAVLLLVGCATPPQLSALQRQWPAQLPAQVLLTQVPFFPDDDDLCGPSTLAALVQFAGKNASPAELTAQVYLPGRKGALQLEMLAAARRQALVAYPLAPSLQTLLAEVASGHPVLVLQNLSLPIRPMWHYAVVVGYDRERQEVLLNSGLQERMPMPLSTFEHTWARSEHWAFRLTAPSQLPVSAQADPWATAVAALERVHPLAAQTAYRTALQNWPGHRISLLGLGNTAYTLGQRQEAALAYEATTQAHPDFADAWNNLAQVRLELGQLRAARDAVEQALALGGPRLPLYQALLARIDSAQAR